MGGKKEGSWRAPVGHLGDLYIEKIVWVASLLPRYSRFAQEKGVPFESKHKLMKGAEKRGNNAKNGV